MNYMKTNEFLYKEYELCFEQLRFYDNRNSDLLKYLFTLTSAVATAQFAVYKFLKGPTHGFFACQAFLSIVVFIATLLLYLAMLQNRLYFVYIARQINAIRGYLMQTEAVSFKDNQLYTSTNFPALKPSSVHTFQLLGASFLSSLFAGVSVYALYPALGNSTYPYTSLFIFVLVWLAEVIGGILYLSRTGKKTSDDAIHGQGGNSNNPEQEGSQEEK